MSQTIKLKRGTTTPTTSNIVSGEVAIDTSAQKLYINDAGTIKEIGGGTGSISVSDVPNLPASKITSGTFASARIPGLPGSRITSGTIDVARLPTIPYSQLSGTPTIPSAPANATITISAGASLTGGGNFTTNQSTNETITINHQDTSSQGSVNNSNGTVIQDITLDTNGHITSLGSVNLDGRYYTESEADGRFGRLTSNNTWTGTQTFNGVVNGIYHGIEEDHYYFDSYTGARNVTTFLKTQRSDIIKYRAISNPEYWNGSAWADMSSQESKIKLLLDGRQDTSWSVPSTYYKFRFEVTASTGWPTLALIGAQMSWTGSTYPGYTMTVEEKQTDNTWSTKVTAPFTSANGITNWGTHFRADSALHTGRTQLRITVDFSGWTPSNSSYTTIPLQNIFIYSNYAGLENNDYQNLLDYDRNITAPNNLYIPYRMYHNGDTDTYLQFDSNRVRLVAGGVTKFDSNNTYLTSAITTVQQGNLIDVSTNGGTAIVNVDLSEATDMTQAWDNSVDEFIVLDNGSQKRKRSAEIFGSNAFNSTTIPAAANNGTMTITAGTALTGGGSFTANQSGNTSVTINHGDTSTQASVNNSGNTVIQDITLDTHGHITGITSKALSIPSAPANATITIAAGTNLTGGGNFTTNQSSNETITINHEDVSSQGSVNNSGGTVIQDVTLNANGHVTSLGSANLDNRYYTESEMKTFFKRGYIESHSASNLAVGWYTIATQTGDRALGEFTIWDMAGGDHQAVIFNASHHFGVDNSNDINVLANSRYSGTNFRYIRIKDGSTYEGAALQVYVDGNTNSVAVAITGSNAQSSGWVLKDWIADATDPGDLTNYSSMGERVKVDLDHIINGGMLTSGDLKVNGNVGVGIAPNGSYPMYVAGTIAQSTGSIIAYGDVQTGYGGFKKGSTYYINSSGVLANVTANANIITSGTFADGRIPSLNASKITAGTFAAARIPSLDASKITSGTLGTARIPNLSGAKITSGTVAAARIANLDAGKITSGTFATARIPTGISITGNAATATKWANARTITLSGDLSGSVSLDGSSNVTLSAQVSNNSHEHSRLTERSAISFGASQLQWMDNSGNGGTGLNGAEPKNPFSDWHHHLIMNHGNSNGYYVDIAASFHSDRLHFRRMVAGTLNDPQEIFHDGYHPNADKWTTARTISLTGHVTGSVSVDGSANASISTSIAAPADVGSNWRDVVAWSGSALVKDSAVDIHGSGYLRAVYLNMTHGVGTRNSDTVFYSSTDDYIRKNNASGFRTALDVYSKSETSALIPSTSSFMNLSSAQTASGFKTFNGNLAVADSVQHAGDSDTKIDFTTNRVRIYAGNTVKFDSNNNYLTTTGTANTAYRWLTARTLTLAGDLSGSVSFNGSSNFTLTATVADDSHNHTIANVDGLQTALNAKYASGSTIVAADGTGAAPSHTFSSDTDTGLYRYGTNVMAVTAGGTRRARFGSTIFLESNDVRINAYLYHNGDTDTHLRFENDRIIMKAGNVEMLDMVEGSTDYVDIVDRVRVTAGGNLECEGNIVAFSTASISDINQKENIQRIESPIEKIKQISGYTFDWKNSGEHSGGVIAQEVEEIMPSIIKETSIRDSETMKSVDYQALVGLLVETVKDLNARIEELENGNH